MNFIIMLARKIFLSISRVLAKVIFGLLLVLLTVICLIHLPPIQRQITPLFSRYLSTKLQSRIEIERVDFSIFGNVQIENLTVWDTNTNKIFFAREIQVTSSLFAPIRGDFIFDEIRIAGVNGHLIQREEGWNIQFIIDAFKPAEKRSTESTEVKLQFKRILLENISVDYTSAVNGTALTADIGKFTSENVKITSSPDKLQADKVYLECSVVNILSTQGDTSNNLSTSQQNNFFSPDFGTGVVFEITDAELKDTRFSFHVNQKTKTTKFNPSHLDLKEINVGLSKILIREDTLVAALQSLSLQLPEFKLSDSKAEIHMNRNQLVLSGVHVGSGANEFNAEVTGWCNSPLSNGSHHPDLQITALARINPVDLSYFLNDSILSHFDHWSLIEVTLEGMFTKGTGDIKLLNLKTANSQLQAAGIIHSELDLKKIYWKNMTIKALIGPDFKRTIQPFLRGMRIPADLKFDLKSSGNSKNFFVDGKILTKWGDARATGRAILYANDIEIDMNLQGHKVDLGKFTDLYWLGPMDLAVDAKGIIGNDTDVKFKGLIDHVQIKNQRIRKIAFQSKVIKSSATTLLAIDDPDYRSEISSKILFEGPLILTTGVELHDFNLGSLLRLDSTLSVSGVLNSKIKIDQTFIEGFVGGKRISFVNPSFKYSLDSIMLHAMLSPKASRFNYLADDGNGALNANFDIRDLQSVLQTRRGNILNSPNRIYSPAGTRTINFNFQLDNAQPFQLLGIDIDEFSDMSVAGEFDEQKQTAALRVTGERFTGYGISADNLRTTLLTLRDSVVTNMDATELSYNSIHFGNLNFDLHTEGDTAVTNLLLSDDSLSIVDVSARILRSDSGIFVYPDKLLAFDNDYIIDRKNPVFITNGNIVLNQFVATRDDIQVGIDGDLKAFDLDLTNLDLTTLNQMLFVDSTLINNGRLNANISYTQGQEIDIRAYIDSLSVYDSDPLMITVKALSDQTLVPFEILVSNASNKLNLNGEYLLNTNQVDATLMVDVNNLANFKFLVSEIVNEMNGTVKGKATISGPIQNPRLNGSLRFLNAGFKTSNPKLTFKVADESIAIDNSSVLLKDFTIYDPENNSLNINGQLTFPDYKSFNYDLQLHTNKYTLLNNPDSANSRLTGLLVVGGDLKLTGNGIDTNVKANVNIKDTTSLTFTVSSDEIKLLNSEGIIDFVDPLEQMDPTIAGQSSYFYDSLIARLPEFDFNSSINIEENARIRIIMDPQSGDFIRASGGATLELGYDRTGNVSLSGTYTIKEGVYGVSFYNLVKKNFQLVPGSAINWSGSPENGSLDIKAVYTVRSSSVALMGNEIGENEKSIYKRALPYDVGINIKGTIESPLISFSLDLPRDEKVNYPVLANKLDRLKQPEFQSELNKQVFGVLVLGGFLPETSGADIDQNVIATTALSNSVNSLLSGQLNRFASQYIKGVDIDVGLQSYSDYAAAGGKTQTAMDFRVTKRIMDDRLSFEIGGDFNLTQDQSGTNTGDKNFRGDVAIIYDLTEQRNKKIKLFNNETYDIIYQEIRNTGISLIFIREFDRNRKPKKLD